MKTTLLEKKLSNSKPNAFICYNTEHVLTSLILSYYSHDKNYIYICNRFSNYRDITRKINNNFACVRQAMAIDDNKLKEISTQNIFSQIIKLLFYKKYLKNIFHKKVYIRPLKLSDIFMYNDGQFLSQYIVTHYDNLNLIEEGIGNYANIKLNFASLLKKMHGIYPPYGCNPKIKNIFVKRPQDLPQRVRKKGSYFNKSKYINVIPADLSRLIIKTFLNRKKFKPTLQNSALLITQPFSEDLVIKEEKKKSLYSEIIDKLNQKYRVYIKPHPREKTDYSFLKTKAEEVYDHTFPVEIINYVEEVDFDIAVTLSSSAIERIKPEVKTYKLGDILSDKEKYFKKIKKNLNKITKS